MGYTDNKSRRSAGAAAVSLLALIWGGVPALAQPEPAGSEQAFSIGPGTLADALQAISLQTGVPVIFSEALVAGHRTSGISGYLGTQAALAELLSGSGLEAVPGAGGYIIRAEGRRREEGPVRTPTQPLPDRVPAPVSGPAEPDLRVDRVTVTGTSLRGIAPESSPLQIYSREDILASGVTTTEQFIRTLPQNFGGGSTEFAAVIGLPNDSNSQFNSTFGTSANLRGLGSRGTLTLLNGNRMAPTSEIGDFIDISMIPLSAIARVDVLTDGASSIYGGDAVAGVMNFVLRDDYDGAETSLLYGKVSQGDMEEYRFSQALGRTWGSGNLLATYEFHDRGSLTLADRPQIAFPPPANPSAEISLEDFDLLPSQRRHSAVLTGRQRFGAGTELSATGLYSRREADSTTFGGTSTITTANYQAKSETVSLALGLTHDLPGNWQGGYRATFGEVRNREVARNVAPVMSDPRLKTTRSEMWSLDGLFDGPVFRMPGGEVKAAAGGHYREESFRNALEGSGANRAAERRVGAVFGEVLLPLTGSDNPWPLLQRLELSLSGRYDDYSDYGSRFSPKAGLIWALHDGVRFRGSYSESFAPPPLGRVGDLGRTGAVMPYANILRIFDVEAPLPELADMNYLQLVGTAQDLDPETSTTITLGFDADRSWGGHSWKLRSTYYDISFEGRLGATPIPGNLNANLAPNIAFADPGAFPDGTVIFFPSQAEIDAILSTFNLPPVLVGGVAGVTNIGVVNSAFLVRNLASTETRGIDIQLAYETDLGGGTLTGGLNTNYIIDFRQQAAATSPVVDAIDTFLNPVSLQMRGHAGYRRGGLSGAMFINYRDSYRTDNSADARPIGAWTTVDLTLSYEAGEASPSWLRETEFSINAINLFNRLPPATPTIGVYRITGFDPTNANPLRRFVSFGIRKSF